jgi:DNA ligase-1
MNSDELLDYLDLIAFVPGRADKHAMLRQKRDDVLLRDVLKAAYDPTQQYYIKKIPSYRGSVIENQFDHVTFALLEDLSSRRLTGQAAQQALLNELSRLSLKSSRLLERIIQRDLRIGVAEKGILEVFAGIFPTFCCMLATGYSDKAAVWPALASPKLDGMRILAYVDRDLGRVNYYSRNGKVVETMGHIDEALFRLEVPENRFWIDGEATSGTGFADSISAAKKKSGGVLKSILNVFDVLPEALETDAPYSRRYEQLLSAVAFEEEFLKPVASYLVLDKDQAFDAYATFRDAGYEGAILKNPESGYYGSRSKAWLKIKPTETLDLPVIGAYEGQGKYVGMLGGVVVDHIEVPVRVGSGFSDSDRASLWQIWNETPQLLLGRLLEVSFHEVTDDGSLRHPRAKKWRDDKSKA